MTETEARARCPMLVTRLRVEEHVASARHALLEAALAVSPRIEDGGAGLAYIDTVGLERLIGDPATIGRRLVHQMRANRADPAHRARGEPDRRADRGVDGIGSGDHHSLRTRARDAREDFPRRLDLASGFHGDNSDGGESGRSASLAALPREGLAARPWDRPGSALTIWRSVSTAIHFVRGRRRRSGKKRRGSSGRSTRSASSPGCSRPCWSGSAGDSRRYCSSPIRSRSGSASASGGHHARDVSLAYPMSEVKPMLTLAVLDLEAHPPPAAVDASHDQRPSDPDSRGAGRASGTARACSSRSRHGARPPRGSRRRRQSGDRPCSSIRTAPMPSRCSRFRRRAMPQRPVAAAKSPPRLGGGSRCEGCGRRGAWRSRSRASVRCAWSRGSSWPPPVHGEGRASGGNHQAWARDEWDVVLGDGALCRLVRDRLAGHWYLDGFYD